MATRYAWWDDELILEHDTASPDCWCEPEVEELEDGSLLVVHRDRSEGN